MPPALPLVAGAALAAVTPRAARRLVAIVVPLLALWQVVALPDGAVVTLPFLAYELEVLRVDALSRLFAALPYDNNGWKPLTAARYQAVLELAPKVRTAPRAA